MTRFDDELWREIERTYGSKLTRAPGPLQHGARRRRSAIAGSTLGVMGASAAAVIVFGAASSPPAFAVTRHPDGTVSVIIRRIEGVAGANRRLTELGIPARAVQVAGGCQAAVSPSLRHVTIATLIQSHRAVQVSGGEGKINARIRPDRIPIGRTLVIPAVGGGAQVRLGRGRTVRGAVPSCLPPAVMLRSASRGARAQVLGCRAGVIVRHPPVAVGPDTDTTTDSGTVTNSGAATNPGTVTNPGRVTNSTTATATATAPGTTTDPSSTGPSQVLPPPLMRACVRAAQAVPVR